MHGRRAVSVMPRSSAYESSQDNYAMDDSINRAEYFSNAVLEDTYNQALSSRGRDDDLLRSANATIERARSMAPDLYMGQGNWAPSTSSLQNYGDLISLSSNLQTSSSAMQSSQSHAYNTEHRPLAPRSSIVTRRMRASSVPPRQVRAPRRSVQAPRRVHYSYPKVAESSTPSRHALISLTPTLNLSSSAIPANRTTPKPVVLSVNEALRDSRAMRAGSVPPMGTGSSQGQRKLMTAPNQIVTSHLRASKPPARGNAGINVRPRSMEPQIGRQQVSNQYNQYRPPVSGYYSLPRAPMKKSVRYTPPNQDRSVIRRQEVRSISEPRRQEYRASDYYPAIPDVGHRVITQYARTKAVPVYARQPVTIARQTVTVARQPVTVTRQLPPKSPANIYSVQKSHGPSNISSKAAIIGSRMGAGDGERRRQPRTQYAANKQREVLLDDMERKYK